jgi:hypothetical protein
MKLQTISSLFSFLLVIFALLDPDQQQTKLNLDQDPKHCIIPIPHKKELGCSFDRVVNYFFVFIHFIFFPVQAKGENL